MFEINKNNILTGILGLLPALFTTKLKTDVPIYYGAILIYLIPFFILREKKLPSENMGEYIPVTLMSIHFAWIVDWLIFGGFIFIYIKFLDFLPDIASKNHFILPNYVVMMQNVLGRSIGFKIFRIYPDNRTLIGKLKIFGVNFFLMSSWYLAMFKSVWHIPSEEAVKAISTPLITIFFINYALRLNVFKTQSLCEKLLGIQSMQFVPVKSKEDKNK